MNHGGSNEDNDNVSLSHLPIIILPPPTHIPTPPNIISSSHAHSLLLDPNRPAYNGCLCVNGFDHRLPDLTTISIYLQTTFNHRFTSSEYTVALSIHGWKNQMYKDSDVITDARTIDVPTNSPVLQGSLGVEGMM